MTGKHENAHLLSASIVALVAIANEVGLAGREELANVDAFAIALRARSNAASAAAFVDAGTPPLVEFSCAVSDAASASVPCRRVHASNTAVLSCSIRTSAQQANTQLTELN